MVRNRLVRAKLRYLREILGTLKVVSEVLNVSQSTVARWVKGKTVPDQESDIRITGICYVIVRLSRLYKREVVPSWLMGLNACLNNQRPIDVLKRGRIVDVLSAIEQDAAGSYA